MKSLFQLRPKQKWLTCFAIIYIVCPTMVVSICRTLEAEWRFEDFSSDPDWTSYNLPANGNDFGFLPSGFAGGDRGEAGGTFIQSPLSYYADTSIGLLGPGTVIEASGTLNLVNEKGDYDNNIFIGHFNTLRTGRVHAGQGPQVWGIGLQVVEDSRVFNLFGFGGEKQLLSIDQNTPYEWSYRYDPVDGEFGSLFVTVGGWSEKHFLSSQERFEIGGLDAFGIANKPREVQGNLGTAELYIDNLSYTVSANTGPVNRPVFIGAPVDSAEISNSNELLGFEVSGHTYSQADLIQPELANFVGCCLGRFELSTIITPSDGNLPNSGQRAALLTDDFFLDTGVINPAHRHDAVSVVFSTPLVNGPGPELVIFEAGVSGVPESLILAVDDHRGDIVDASSFGEVLSTYSAATWIPSGDVPSTIDELEDGSFTKSWEGDVDVFGVAIDLSDLGIKPFDNISRLSFGSRLRRSQARGGEVDPVLVMGIDSSSLASHGDFDHDGRLDVADIDLLTVQILEGTHQKGFDLTGDGRVDAADHTTWIHNVKRTYFGDANLDGEFNSSDLVEVFQVGKYEAGDDAGWVEGDWDADGFFGSGDLVIAFQDGGYEQGPREAVIAVPEPTSCCLSLLAGVIVVFLRRRNFATNHIGTVGIVFALLAISTNANAQQVEFLYTLGGTGASDGQFVQPVGIGLDNAGNVYVSEWGGDRIQVFNDAGTFQFKFGRFGHGDGEFDDPAGIDVDDAGNIYVAGWRNDRLQVFDNTGRFKFSFGNLGTGTGEFDDPAGVVLDDANQIYTTDFRNDRMQVFDAEGNLQSVFGGPGSGDGEFNGPALFSFDNVGNIYVAEQFGNRIQVRDHVGTFQFAFGSTGTGPGQFREPTDAVYYAGRVYVADQDNHRIQVFDIAGNFQFAFGSFGTGVDNFNQPTDIAIDTSGKLYVTDWLNDRVQVWQVIFETSGLLGDFNQSESLDGEDIDLLTSQIISGNQQEAFDLTQDGVVDQHDRVEWIESLANTYFGDANLDGEFNSGDLVAVFEAGQYEDDITGNSGWATGDWSGDAEFSTSDLVLAFQDGGYEQGPRPAVQAVPEPTSLVTILSAMVSVLFVSRGTLINGRRHL